MRRILLVFAFLGCSNTTLVPAARPPQGVALRVPANDARTLPTAELGQREPGPARIGPPVGRGAGSRRIPTRDDAPTLESSTRLAEMDSVSSLHRE